MENEMIKKAQNQYESIKNNDFSIEVLYCLNIKDLKEFEAFEESVITENPNYHNLTDYSVCDYSDKKIGNGFEKYKGEELIFVSDFSIALALEEDLLKIFDKNISKGRKRVFAFGTKYNNKEELFKFIMENIKSFENEYLTKIFDHILYFED